MVIEKPHVRPSGTSSYGSKNRSLTTTTRPGGRSAPSQRWRGCRRYVRTAWCCDGLTSATPSVDFATPRSLCCSGGGVCRPPGRTSESRCSSNTAQTPTMLWRGHMLMILARLVRSESFWAVVKVRSPHTVPEVCYIITKNSVHPLTFTCSSNSAARPNTCFVLPYTCLSCRVPRS